MIHDARKYMGEVTQEVYQVKAGNTICVA